MPQYDDEYEDDEVPDPRVPNDEREDRMVTVSRSHIRNLEGSGKRATEAEQRAEAAERRLAFAEAGISLDPTDERAAFFVGGYQGELTRDAIRAKAELMGVLTPATPDPTPTPQPDTPLEDGEANLGRERAALAAGANADQPPPEDPYKVARDVHDKVLEDGGLEKHALGAAINSVVNAAHRGDKRVIIPSLSMQALGAE